MCACGIFPELSESASDGLHSIVNELATDQLHKRRHLRNLESRLNRLVGAAKTRSRANRELFDGLGNDLTALLASEATAAYLFGLSVGLTVRSLPEQLDERG